MAFIPEAVRYGDLISGMETAGLKHLNSGKTGELFRISDLHLLMVRTDRVSIFDFVLGNLIKDKGAVLTAMTVLWLEKVLKDLLRTTGGHHMVAFGAEIDNYLPTALQGITDLQRRALVIKLAETPDFEAIVRGYLTGSALKPYGKDRIVCGHELPPGLHDGSMLENPIFTPSTKATTGHDEHVDWRIIEEKYGKGPAETSIAIFEAARDYALSCGVIIADTKFELSQLANGLWMVIDEILTPDSSRFWLETDWLVDQNQDPPKSPTGFDKQFVREFGKSVPTPFQDAIGNPIKGIHKLNPTVEVNAMFVGNVAIPENVKKRTTNLYRKGFRLLAGTDLEAFQGDFMGINA